MPATARYALLPAFAALLLGCSAPVVVTPAAEREVGAINVSSATYTDVRWSRFGGPVDHFTFVPVNDTIDCRHVTINYFDGTVHDVFSGTVLAGAHTTISLPPPNDGRVRDVTFACKAQSLDGARIVLTAVTDAWPRGWETAGDDRPVHVEQQASTR